MTQLENLEQQLNDEGFIIQDMYIQGAFSAFSYADQKLIVVNKKLTRTSKEKYCVLSHEKAHFEHNLFFNSRHFSKEDVNAQERIVELSVAKKLVPMNTLRYLLFDCKMVLYEISDFLEVTEDVIITAYNHYRNLEDWVVGGRNIQYEY